MDIMLLDSKYNLISIIDQYIAINWAVRKKSAGDFELILPASSENMERIKEDLYLSIPQSDRYMVIEKIVLKTDIDDGDTLTVTGRTLESILDRRIVIEDEKVSGNVQKVIKQLLENNIIYSTSSSNKRKIPGFVFKETSDPNITSITVESSNYYKQNLYDVICAMAERYNFGFRILPFGEGGFEFELYYGTDRSYDQTQNSYVVFSPKFDNLISTNYVKTNTSYKNVCYVNYNVTISGSLASGESIEHTFHFNRESSIGDPSGLSRREMSIDSQLEEISNESPLTYLSVYQELLKQEGLDTLNGQKSVEAMDGELDSNIQFTYGIDYFLGDIVQVENSYGIRSKCEITEFLISEDSSGLTMVPTFEFI